MDSKELPIVMDIGMVAKVLGLGKTKVYSLIADGTIPSMRVGRKIIVTQEMFLTFLGMGGVKND